MGFVKKIQALVLSDFNFEFLGGLISTPQKLKLNVTERTAFYDRMRRLILGGKDYYSSLKIIRELTIKRRQNKETRKRIAIYDVAIQKMESSRVGLGEAFSGSIPEGERNLITASEAGEHIEVGIDAAIMISKLNGSIKQDISLAIMYPVAIFTVILGGIAFFGQTLLPQFASFLPVSEWEPMGQKLYYLSTTVQYWAPLMALIFLGLFFLYVQTVHNWVGSNREKIDEYVIFYNINKTIQSSIFLISLSAYLRSGIPFVNALKKINNETKSLWMKKNIEVMIEQTRNSGDIGATMIVPMFDEESKEDLAIYSRSNADEFTKAMAEIGEAGVKRALKRINAVATKIKFLLTAVGGVTILGIYISVLSVGNNIQKVV